MNLRDRGDGFFAENLSYLLRRQRNGIGCTELAEILGENPRRIRRLASGTTLPHYDEIPRIARVLGVRPEHLAWMEPEAFRRQVPVFRSVETTASEAQV